MLHEGFVVPSVASLRHLFNDLSTASYVRYVWKGHDRASFSFEEANDWRQSMDKMTSADPTDRDEPWMPVTVNLYARLVFTDIETYEKATIRFTVIASKEGGDCCFETPVDKFNEYKGMIQWLAAQIGLVSAPDIRIETGRDSETAEEILIVQQWYDFEVTPDRNNLLVEAAENSAYWNEWNYMKLIKWLDDNHYHYALRKYWGIENVELKDLQVTLRDTRVSDKESEESKEIKENK